MNRTKRLVFAVAAGALLIGSAAACTTTTSPSHVGLYYYVGPSEGNEFNHCTVPSKTDSPYPVNDEIWYVPVDGRTWYIDDTDGADSKELTLVTAKPEPGQSTGAAVKISSQTSFYLNSYCGTATDAHPGGDDKNSPLIQWWQKYGRGYGADVDPDQSAQDQRNDPGWVNMLRQVLVPALNTAIKDTAKNYPASALVSGAANSPMTVDGVERKGLRTEIGESLASELKRLTGGEYFCGPSFTRASPECPNVEVTTQAEYASADLLLAQGEKQAAAERAQAAVIEAQGKVDAAAKLGSLLNNPAWLEYQKALLQLQAVQECAKNPNCTIVMPGASVNVNTK
jgi:hypothetical protein